MHACICAWVHLYVCMYPSVLASVCVCMHLSLVCLSLRVHVFMCCTSVSAWLHEPFVSACIWVCMCLCVASACLCVCVYSGDAGI